jgi:hypothetical protein
MKFRSQDGKVKSISKFCSEEGRWKKGKSKANRNLPIMCEQGRCILSADPLWGAECLEHRAFPIRHSCSEAQLTEGSSNWTIRVGRL